MVDHDNLDEVENMDELIYHIKEVSKPRKTRYCSLENLFINFSLEIPFNEKYVKTIQQESAERVTKKRIAQLNNLEFKNCKFIEVFNTRKAPPLPLPVNQRVESKNINFIECEFDKINFNDSYVDSKVRFNNCNFYNINFQNTIFKELADFFNCTFNSPVSFYKTDFKGTTVFSATTFKQNVLFTYSLIEKLIIFRGTKFEEGLDLSCAIVTGEINPFDIRLGDFKPEIIKEKDENDFEKRYEECITMKGLIPIKNQRETYRILKEAFIKREDIASSIKFKVLEKETLRKELSHYPSTNSSLVNFLESFNLTLNWESSKHASSYGRALGFTFLIGTELYIIAVIPILFQLIGNTEIENGFLFLAIKYVNFMIPTHDFNFMAVHGLKPNFWFYFFDFWGRIFVGYGIYQFIQAFRKYR